jgi:hypothetical protein
MVIRAIQLMLKYRAAMALFRSARSMLPAMALPLLGILAVMFVGNEIRKHLIGGGEPTPEDRYLRPASDT